jgi:hypothetical protein
MGAGFLFGMLWPPGNMRRPRQLRQPASQHEAYAVSNSDDDGPSMIFWHYPEEEYWQAPKPNYCHQRWHDCRGNNQRAEAISHRGLKD